MKKYVCTVCGYVYDEAKGIPDAGIPAGTKWEELPDDWVCPLCGASKDEFKLQDAPEENKTAQPIKTPKGETAADLKELTAAEISAICSNLARGCEKQYKNEEAALFTQLADYFKGCISSPDNADYDGLLTLVNKDIDEVIPEANGQVSAEGDRGALRALVWNEKVTRILKSLLTRYQKEGEAMLQNTRVYVCTICGFIYIGDTPPELCPVCKVPSWKFVEAEGRAV